MVLVCSYYCFISHQRVIIDNQVDLINITKEVIGEVQRYINKCNKTIKKLNELKAIKTVGLVQRGVYTTN